MARRYHLSARHYSSQPLSGGGGNELPSSLSALVQCSSGNRNHRVRRRGRRIADKAHILMSKPTLDEILDDALAQIYLENACPVAVRKALKKALKPYLK